MRDGTKNAGLHRGNGRVQTHSVPIEAEFAEAAAADTFAAPIAHVTATALIEVARAHIVGQRPDDEAVTMQQIETVPARLEQMLAKAETLM